MWDWAKMGGGVWYGLDLRYRDYSGVGGNGRRLAQETSFFHWLFSCHLVCDDLIPEFG